jgi:TolB-like protein/Flp pilus assembly protein TadD
MQGEPPTKASAPTGAVFLSYASQDAGAARRICEALRAAGIEVWFDQSELKGGDAWDHKIRDQIHDCRLFIPVISANTERRDEGYFRREWSLAVDRTRDMVHKRTFLVPVVIDGTPERGAAVPEKFHEVQWTRLPGGEVPPVFVERIGGLFTPEAPPAVSEAAPSSAGGVVTAPSVRRSPLPMAAMWITAAIAGVVCGYLVADKLWFSMYSITHAPSTSQTAPSPGTGAIFNPPPHSIAVLPFVNMSDDREQEYFSEGLTEELLNSLSRINELQVAARTSSFSFDGEHPDIATVAHKLNVGAVLEGSVRRSGRTLRVTTQLINGVTGFRVWSESYDRDLGDVLKLQTEIATAVASALKVALVGNEAAKIELGGTSNPAAFDAYLRARKLYFDYKKLEDVQAAVAGFTEAIRLDPNYALAYAARSRALASFAKNFSAGPSIASVNRDAEVDARKALALAPDLGVGHNALARDFAGALDLARADQEYGRALALEPGNPQILADYGVFAVCMGHTEAGLDALRRARALDPLNVDAYIQLGLGLILARRQDEALRALASGRAIAPDEPFILGNTGIAHYLQGNYQAARASCEQMDQRHPFALFCLAIAYDKLGRHADAEVMLVKLRALRGETTTDIAWVYAQWGQTHRALDALETAVRLRDPYLQMLRVQPLFDPLRKEPRFWAIERALRFP